MLVAFVLSVAVTMAVAVIMPMAMPMTVTIVRVWLDGMGNQVEERIPEQSTGGESEQRLQPRLHFFRVVQRDGEQDKKWCRTDQQRGAERMDPNVEGVCRLLTVNSSLFFMMMVMMAVLVAMFMIMMMMMVSMIVAMAVMMMLMWISYRFFVHFIRMF